jgi:hypothetical protein
VLGGYRRGQLTLALIIGVLAGIGTAVLGLPYAVVLGVLAGCWRRGSVATPWDCTRACAMFALLAGFQLAGLLGGFFAVPLAGVLWVLLGAAYRNVVVEPRIGSSFRCRSLTAPHGDRHLTPERHPQLRTSCLTNSSCYRVFLPAATGGRVPINTYLGDGSRIRGPQARAVHNHCSRTPGEPSESHRSRVRSGRATPDSTCWR